MTSIETVETDGVAGRPSRRRMGGGDIWRELWPFMAASRWRVAVLAASSTAGGVLEAGVLVILVRVAFVISEGRDTLTFSTGPIDEITLTIAEMIVVALAMVLVRLALQMLAAFLAPRMSTDALSELRTRTVEAYLHAEWSKQVGERQGAFQDLATTQIARTVSAILVLSTMLAAGLNLTALLASALLVDTVAASTVIVSVMLLSFALRPLRAASRRASQRMREENVHYADAVSDLLRITQDLRVLSVEDAYATQVRTAIRRTSREYFTNILLTRLVPALYQGVALMLVVLALAAVAAAGADDVLGLGAVVLLLVRALNYGNVLQSNYQQLNDLVPYAQHIRGELASYEANRVVDGDHEVARVGQVVFDHVGFAYGDGPTVLDDLSFEIEPGECVGVVGPSGAGKSTIVQLLLRLRRPDRGRVLIDGVSLADLRGRDWYRCIGYVPQDPALIVGTVAENIRFFRDDITDEMVERASRRAHLHDEVERMPMGYDTPIGPRDNTISGGQRQRLCIARALATDPTLLVLDEPTSALDSRSEQIIRETLDEMKGSVTVIVIAHRMSTLSLADRIMVLEHGRLTAFLPASELEHASEFFRDALST